MNGRLRCDRKLLLPVWRNYHNYHRISMKGPLKFIVTGLQLEIRAASVTLTQLASATWLLPHRCFKLEEHCDTQNIDKLKYQSTNSHPPNYLYFIWEGHSSGSWENNSPRQLKNSSGSRRYSEFQLLALYCYIQATVLTPHSSCVSPHGTS
jgi:hypothetical protein